MKQPRFGNKMLANQRLERLPALTTEKHVKAMTELPGL